MIKENELRIGNFYEWSDDDEKDLYRIEDAYSLYEKSKIINELIPVELTPEWLIKFGFKKIDCHRFKLKPSKFDWYYTYSFHDNAFRFHVHNTIVCISVIFYVHQLQNLYFALIGEELELKTTFKQ